MTSRMKRMLNSIQEKENTISGNEPLGMLESCISTKLVTTKPRIQLHTKAGDPEGLRKGRWTTVAAHLKSIIKPRGTIANAVLHQSQDVSTSFEVGPLSSNMEVRR